MGSPEMKISVDANDNHVFVDKAQLESIHVSMSKPKGERPMEETNPETLARRQKQIDYGKRTIGYKNYVKLVPKEDRTTGQPRTPISKKKMSRRCWDGQVKIWRLLLHAYDDKDLPNLSESTDSPQPQQP